MQTRWRIELLGGLRAVQADGAITRFRTQKTGILLAYLAYHLQHVHLREMLIELLWPESDPDAGRHSLSQALSSLRHQLEPPGVPAGAVLMADRASLSLNPDAVHTDVDEFAAALQSAAAAGSGAEREQDLVRAVDLYRGELLPGYFESWILQERAWLAQQYFQGLRELLAHLEAAGGARRALEYAWRGVSADPLREEGHRDLVRLLAAVGQPSAALRQFQELERLLKAELGALPAPATRALARELERRIASAPPPVPAGGVETAPSGVSATTKDAASTPPDQRPARSSPLPHGTVTFLLTDIEGSTAAWERARQAFAAALASHHELLRGLFRRHEGHEVKLMGDGFLAAFARAGDGLACAIAAQRALAAHPWPEEVGRLRVRMALHTGDVEVREGEYHGLALHYATRVLLAAHGGQVLLSEESATLLRRDLEPAVQLADLGVYRLRDVTTPERLFQVEYPGMLQQRFPPLRAEPAYANNLPISFSRFFDREAECDRLSEILRGGEARLVTLTGPGGSGKTRLALEVARRLADAWRGSVWFVALTDLSDPCLIGHAVRDSLRLPLSPEVEPLEQVASALSHQPTLLLLDNFEQLVPAGASFVRALLERVPALTCLATSRQRLGLEGEREFPVLPLPVPAVGDCLERLVQCESVKLFVDRAQAVRPDFQVTPTNAAATAALCQRLEGIPLALELAAARAQVLSPGQMLAHLEQRFDLLVSRRLHTAARHRTLRGAIDWSYQLLAPELQRFFAGLSVFRGGWTLAAAEAICEADTTGLALDYLEQLRECSLVMVDEEVGEIRFRMLETLRAYAREHLAPDEWAALSDRHGAFYAALAEEAASHLNGPDQKAWLDRLEREHENLRVALDWALASASTTHGMNLAASPALVLGLRMGGALWSFWAVRGHVAEGRERLGRVLALSFQNRETLDNSVVSPSGLRARALRGAGELASDHADYPAARAFHEESLVIGRALADRQSIAATLLSLGKVAYNQGEYGEARTLMEESLAIFRQLGDRPGMAEALSRLGTVIDNQGDHGTAAAYYQESLALHREAGNMSAIGWVLTLLGSVSLRSVEYAAARALSQESLVIFRELGQPLAISNALMTLGNVARYEGDYSEARALYEESLAIYRELGDRRGIGWSLDQLANVALHLGDYERARSLYEESLAIHYELGNRLGIAWLTNSLGNVAVHLREHEKARSLYEESLRSRRELGDRRGICDSLEGLAKLASAVGQEERAVTLFAASAAWREANDHLLPSHQRPEQETCLTTLREALGETAFAAAWAAGHALALEEAAAEALQDS